VSLASLSAALALPFAFVFSGVALSDPLFIASVVFALVVFATHRANIGRLRRGEEHRFARKPRAPAATPEPHAR
jgi:glycerol-3-phosphate acyltransferase PlsY